MDRTSYRFTGVTTHAEGHEKRFFIIKEGRIHLCAWFILNTWYSSIFNWCILEPRNAFRPIVQEKNCNRLQVIKWTRVIKHIISQFIFRWAFAMAHLKLVRCRSICKGSWPQLQPNHWFARCTLLTSSFSRTYLKPSPCNKLSVAIVKVPDLLSLNHCKLYLY